jgi:heme/copper-type cytochrome/quinol oxidase subunit 1
VIPMFWLGYCGMPRRVLDYPFVLGGWHSIATSGHLLSVAAMVSFFIMIYDSIRQSKSPVRRTFGPSRFNTRLNFYLYESYRVSFIQRRSFFMVRSRINPIYENRLFKPLKVANREINLFSYYLVQK